jgi:hypothetical protein
VVDDDELAVLRGQDFELRIGHGIAPGNIGKGLGHAGGNSPAED